MPGKHNAGGCGCCGECWPCAKPTGITVSIPSATADCGNCEFGAGTFPVGSWQVTASCCTEAGSTGTFYYQSWTFKLTIGVFSGQPYATVTAIYTDYLFDISETGSHATYFSPCSVPWANIVGETIDGWTTTLNTTTQSNRFYYQTWATCPTTDQSLPYNSSFGGFDSGTCPANNLTVTLLMT